METLAISDKKNVSNNILSRSIQKILGRASIQKKHSFFRPFVSARNNSDLPIFGTTFVHYATAGKVNQDLGEREGEAEAVGVGVASTLGVGERLAVGVELSDGVGVGTTRLGPRWLNHEGDKWAFAPPVRHVPDKRKKMAWRWVKVEIDVFSK